METVKKHTVSPPKRGGLAVGHWTCDLQVASSIPGRSTFTQHRSTQPNRVPASAGGKGEILTTLTYCAIDKSLLLLIIILLAKLIFLFIHYLFILFNCTLLPLLVNKNYQKFLGENRGYGTSGKRSCSSTYLPCSKTILHYNLQQSAVINLNAVVATVRHQNDVVTILCDARWFIELARTPAILPNLKQRLSFVVRLVTDTPACRVTKEVTRTLDLVIEHPPINKT